MKSNSTIVRSLHDVGVAGWFGSVLMAAVATNRAAGDADDPVQVGRFTNGVWRRWRLVNGGLVVAHLVGATGLLVANRKRIGVQAGVGASSTAKALVTAAAVAATGYSGALGRTIDRAGPVPMSDGTTPSPDTPEEIAAALQRQTVLQWVIPVLTAVIIALGAFQGEQQRLSNVLEGTLRRLDSAS